MTDFQREKTKSYDGYDDKEKDKAIRGHVKTKTMFNIPIRKSPSKRSIEIIENDREEEEEEIQLDSNNGKRKQSKDDVHNQSSEIQLVTSALPNTKTITNPISMLNQAQLNKRRNSQSQFKTMKEGDIIRNIILAERECDNDYETNECFLKLKIEEFNTAFCTVVTIVSSLFYHELTKFPNQALLLKSKPFHDRLITFSLCMTLISSVLFILCSINRYLIILQLNKSISRIIRNTSFWRWNYSGYFFIETVIALLHPTFGLEGKSFHTYPIVYIQDVSYYYNDIFCFIVLMRVYVIFRFFIAISQFYSARGFRIAKLIGNRLNRLFVVKCIIMVSPFTFLLVSTVIIILMLSFMLKIIEGAAYGSGSDINNDYRKISNCIWNVIVTMTTVGYGDYYPITTLGRFICVVASVGGTCLTSFMVLTLQNSFQFTENEEKAFHYREKAVMRNNVEKKAAIFFKYSFQFIIAKKKYERGRNSSLPRNKLKKLKEKMKNCFYQKAESKKKFKSLTKLYRNTYEVLTESSVLKSKLADFQENLSQIQRNCDEMEAHLTSLTSVLNEIEALQQRDSF